jgi:phosphonoacetaldehyde hydrolase
MTKATRIRAIMLDWAGTTVDHGSIAPVLALQSLFAQHGIDLNAEDARRDMGLLKRDHIQAILSLVNIREEWRTRTGREPGEAEVEALFAEFGPLQMRVIAQNSQLIAGVAETVRVWQDRGIRIGSSTGYTREMLKPVLEQAAESGYRPDASVCPDEAGAGRPAPWMLMRNAQLLNVYPLSLCVKIGDTISDIEEGKNAGMWTIGITRTGNMVGLDEKGWNSLNEGEQQVRLKKADEIMLAAGADFLAEDLSACDSVLSRIEERVSDRSFGV